MEVEVEVAEAGAVTVTRVVGAAAVVEITGTTAAEVSAGAEVVELEDSSTELGTWTLLLGVLVTSMAAAVVVVWAAVV